MTTAYIVMFACTGSTSLLDLCMVILFMLLYVYIAVCLYMQFAFNLTLNGTE